MPKKKKTPMKKMPMHPANGGMKKMPMHTRVMNEMMGGEAGGKRKSKKRRR